MGSYITRADAQIDDVSDYMVKRNIINYTIYDRHHTKEWAESTLRFIATRATIDDLQTDDRIDYGDATSVPYMVISTEICRRP